MSLSITLRPYTSTDFEFLWSTIDSRIAWLTCKGLEGQWGAEPWDSEIKEQLRSRLVEDARRGGFNWIAEVDGQLAGFFQMTPFRPDYLPLLKTDDKPGEELYLRLLVVHTDFGGRGLGEFMLRFAKRFAGERKVDWVRMDCWKGVPGEGKDGLVRYYEGKGFTRVHDFVVPAERLKRVTEYAGHLLEWKVVEV
ncbi:N-acetyltransferase GCN5 [Favolaschia claudopus]|uniref:N-acetyltransferase GCN5 n=1 Tax=Favolaschia claudopus TaxID=2862362 RepID=A0AAW0ATB9_9AGAR